MVAAMSAQHQQRSSYTSFPRTTPRSFSREDYSTHSSNKPSSPWFTTCGAVDLLVERTQSSPMETDESISVHHQRKLTARGKSLVLQNKQKQQLYENDNVRHHHQQQYQQMQKDPSPPNYPTTIQVPSHDNNHNDNGNSDAPSFDEGYSMDLSRLSLEDTFGFDHADITTKQPSMSDELFERLYTGADADDDEDDEGEEVTLQSSSVDLNPYSSKAVDLYGKVNHQNHLQQTTAMLTNNNQRNNLNRYQDSNKTMHRGRESIFRPSSTTNYQQQQLQQQQQSRQTISPVPTATKSDHPRVTTTSEKKTNASMQLISPTVAMDRRRSSSRPRGSTQAQQAISPNSSFFTTNAAPPIQRTSTGTSLRGNNNNTLMSRSTRRHRSTSRTPTQRSRSRGTSQSHTGGRRTSRRSRSRSTSISPKKEDDYHNSLFRGAALIREQLLRSMASADQAMDEADREFLEEMMERQNLDSRQLSQLQAARTALNTRRQHEIRKQEKLLHENDDNNGDDFDCDYSYSQSGEGNATAGNVPSPSRSTCVRFAAAHGSQDSVLESESKRLDNLMGIFGANSSTTSSGVAFTRTSSDKENDVQVPPMMGADSAQDAFTAAHVISPTSESSPSMQKASANSNYAGQYLEEDVSKPIVDKPVMETRPVVSQAEQHQTQTPPVDEALAHAQRAGPLWRSLVGCHVRFPSKWDSLLPPTAPTNISLNQKWTKWYYVARHRVRGDKRLNSREYGVRSRRSGGRILLRIVVREMHTQQVCKEIAIGCFHPNSKGIRKGDPLPEAEDVREVYMAVRWVMESYEDEPPSFDRRPQVGNGCEGVLDNFLMQRRKTLDYDTMGSALGHRKAVNNENVRAVSI